jgi:hypothetical protein
VVGAEGAHTRNKTKVFLLLFFQKKKRLLAYPCSIWKLLAWPASRGCQLSLA